MFGAATIAVGTRGLGDIRFGVVASIVSVGALAGFADLGVGQGLLTRLAVADGRGDAAEMRRLVSSAWTTLLLSGGAVAGLGLLAALLLPWQRLLGAPTLPAGEVTAAVVVAFLVIGAAIPAAIGQRVLAGLQHGAVVNVWTFAGSVLTPGAVALAVVGHAPLWAFVLAFAGVPVIVSAVQSGWVLGRSHPHLRPRAALVTLGSVGQLLRLSSLFLVLNLAVAVAYQSDQLIVAGIAGAAQAAVFAVTIRVFTLLSGLIGSGTQQLWPAMAEALQRGDLAWVRSRFRRVAGATAAVLTVGCALVVAVGQPLIRLWAGPGVVPPVSLLVALSLWTVYATFMTQVSYLLNAAEIVGPQVVMALAMAAVNLGVSLYLTHRIGIIGPVVGSLVAHLAVNGVPAVLIARRVLAGNGPGAEGLRRPQRIWR